MPDYSLVTATHRFYISPTILKNALDSVIRGGKLSDLASPVFFPDSPILQKLFEQFYRWVYAMDDNAVKILKDNTSHILKSILTANPEKMARLIDLDRGNEYDGWGRESSEQIRQGRCFIIYEGQFVGNDDKIYEGVTTFKMDCTQETVIFAQSENQTSPNEERCRCVLELPLRLLKKVCLRAYIEAEHDAGKIADLSEIDLSAIDTDGLEFNHTRFNAAFLVELAKRNSPLNLHGAQLVGSADLSQVRFSQIAIDQPLARQLIQNGADRRCIIEACLASARGSSEPHIELSGFDLRGLDLDGLDLRQVNFRHASTHKLTAAQEKLPGVLFDDNLLDAKLEQSFRDLLWRERAGSILLQQLPAGFCTPHRCSEFTLAQFKTFAADLDELHQQKKVLRNLQRATLRLFNGRIYFIDEDAVAVAGDLDRHNHVTHTPGVPILRMENAMRIARFNGSSDTEIYDYRHDQYCFFTTLMQIFHVAPAPESIDFPDAVAGFTAALKCSKQLQAELCTFLIDPLSTGLSASLPTYLANLELN